MRCNPYLYYNVIYLYIHGYNNILLQCIVCTENICGPIRGRTSCWSHDIGTPAGELFPILRVYHIIMVNPLWKIIARNTSFINCRVHVLYFCIRCENRLRASVFKYCYYHMYNIGTQGRNWKNKFRRGREVQHCSYYRYWAVNT